MSATQQSDRTDRSIQAEAAPQASATAAQRFRAPTVEEALRQARELLGADAEIIEASRIRRGGIGGFFATELGVEVLAQSAAATVAQPGHPAGDSEHADLHAALTRAAGAPVNDLARTPERGRAAWQAASHDLALPAPRTAPSAPAPSATVLRGSHVEPPTSTLFEALIQRVAAEERGAAHTDAPEPPAPLPHRTPKMFRAWRAHDHQHDATIPRLSMFDESQTAESSEAAAAQPDLTFVASTVAEDRIETAETADASSTFASHFLRELMRDAEALRTDPERKPARRRPARSDAPTLPGIADTPDQAEPTATTVVTAPATEPAPAAAAPAPKPPRAKRAPRPRPVAAVTVAEPELPFTPAPAAEAAPAAPADPSTAITSIVDQCMRLASEVSGPSKVALAMTMGDGQVVKITVEMPRGAR